ncbi:MAG: exo-alpha-sialidase, partial [Dysgonamonadaceae bacterium]|nr:exo-alpha-sialidase [Dysgonamonadaceae bacterium]
MTKILYWAHRVPKAQNHTVQCIILLLWMVSVSVSASGRRITPYQGSRIFWDMNSQVTIFPSGGYGRMIELQDGRLLAVAESGGISISFGTNKGTAWSSPQRIASNPAKVTYAVPDVIQLTDGTILVGLNPRPQSPYSTDRRFGIRVMRSTDNGASWSEPYFVFDAQHTFNDGCWEPAFLELPSGEVQCYFANENEYTSNSDQNISMCRSFDKGITWSAPVTVCYRQGARDGMPVPVLLQDESEIVVIIEDNGWPGRGNFAATTVRNTLADNWTKGYVNASSANRSMIFQTTPATNIYSAAPYIRKLPWGETVASYQSNENRSSDDLQYADMYVLVGDERARNFKAKSAPFALGADKHSIWNSVSVIDTGIVAAIGTIGQPNKGGEVVMIKGYPIRQARAAYGTITVDGTYNSSEKWTTSNRSQLYMGQVTKNRTLIDFLYDNEYLYLTARVMDGNIINPDSGLDNDGVRFLIDAGDVSASTPQAGMYGFFFDTNGKIKFQRVNDGAWTTDDNTTEIRYAVNIQSSYYIIEAAIPWSLVGKTSPPVESRMAIAVEIANKEQYRLTTEKIPDVNNNASWTWLEFRLMPHGDTGITSADDEPDIKTFVKANTLYIKSPFKIKELS